MVIKNVNLEIVCGVTSKVPDTAYAEVAFAGKSNVGKSSLINALMNRKALARRPSTFTISTMPCTLSIFRDTAMQRHPRK